MVSSATKSHLIISQAKSWRNLLEGFINCSGTSPLSGPTFWGKAAQSITHRAAHICLSQTPLGRTKMDEGAGCCWYEQGLPPAHLLAPSFITPTQDQRGDKPPWHQWSSFSALSCFITVKSRNIDTWTSLQSCQAFHVSLLLIAWFSVVL